jgi:NAD(P)-dependent dehydrogenase (short-subunit alcohol dehydrogenase family)
MGTPFATTIDGYESQWQVNYLAPFILTYNLLPLMLLTASKAADKTRVRVINLSTEMTAMLGPKSVSLTDVNMLDACGPTAPLYVESSAIQAAFYSRFETRQRYSHSKQGSIRHAKELNDRFSAQGESRPDRR